MPPEAVCPLEIWSENNRKISITKEFCITIDFAPLKKILGIKPVCYHKPPWVLSGLSTQIFLLALQKITSLGCRTCLSVVVSCILIRFFKLRNSLSHCELLTLIYFLGYLTPEVALLGYFVIEARQSFLVKGNK